MNKKARDFAAEGGLVGLMVLLVLSLLVRFRVIQNESIINFFYFPIKIGFYLFSGLNEFVYTLTTGFSEGFAMFIMFSCLILFYHLLGSLIGWIISKNKNKKRGKKR